jgi:hypothetical protein
LYNHAFFGIWLSVMLVMPCCCRWMHWSFHMRNVCALNWSLCFVFLFRVSWSRTCLQKPNQYVLWTALMYSLRIFYLVVYITWVLLYDDQNRNNTHLGLVIASSIKLTGMNSPCSF